MRVKQGQEAGEAGEAGEGAGGGGRGGDGGVIKDSDWFNKAQKESGGQDFLVGHFLLIRKQAWTPAGDLT